MNDFKTFEKIIGGRWTGIKLHHNSGPYINPVQRPMKVCEAIKLSSTGPLTLTKKFLNCPGGLRSLGWGGDDDTGLTKQMVNANGIHGEVAGAIIKNTPYFDNNLSAITVGIYDDPDIVISYAQPKAAMQIIFKWQQLTGEFLEASISSMMAICGCVIAAAYISRKICLSFGCPESRDYGSIGNDRLIVGLPVSLIHQFIN
jgi:uncharacterized protein (DUF169 family)